MKNKRNIMVMLACLGTGCWISGSDALIAANPALPLLNEPVDVSGDFRDFTNLYYLADKLADFDPATGTGEITWQRAEYFTRQAFDNMLAVIKPVEPNEFPDKRIRRQSDPAVFHRVCFAAHGAHPHRPAGRRSTAATEN